MNKENGFVSILIVIIIALVAAKYFFDWSIFDAANSEKGQAAIAYLKQLLGWIKGLVLKVWDYIH